MRRLTKSELDKPFSSIKKNPKKFIGMLVNKSTDNVKTWRNVYERNDNVEQFRKWLRLIHDQNNSNYLGEGYGKTTISGFSGFMTYRYLKLCCGNLDKLKKPGRFLITMSLFNMTKKIVSLNFLYDKKIWRTLYAKHLN